MLFNFWNFAHLRDLFDSVGGRIYYLLPIQLFGTLKLLTFFCSELTSVYDMSLKDNFITYY